MIQIGKNGNTKLGSKMWTVSLSPVKSCPAGVPCAEKCYAVKCTKYSPSAKTAWACNLAVALHDPQLFFDSLAESIGSAKRKPTHMRFHVGGDCPSFEYTRELLSFCKRHKKIRFMIFTKRYSWFNRLRDSIPRNLSVRFSAWPGFRMRENKGFPITYVQGKGLHDRRMPADLQKCAGKCETCLFCWNSKRDNVINLH